jgi:hypothetical protein
MPAGFPASLNLFTLGGRSLLFSLVSDFSGAPAALRALEIRNYIISQAALDAIADSLINDTTLFVTALAVVGLVNAANAPVTLSTARIASLTSRGITVTTV